MQVVAVKTDRISVGNGSIFAVLDKFLPALVENTILVVTSKIVSLTEGSVAPRDADKERLIVEQADRYLPKTYSKYGHHFTIIKNTLIASAGIDESNSDEHFVLWPRDAQASANAIREHLAEKFGLKNIGVLIVDSTSQPLRRGASGIALAHSGFRAVKDYRTKPDLFGRAFTVEIANLAGGLAAAAVLVMGEGSESTPLALITEVPFIEFQSRNPSPEELAFIYPTPADDLFAPFFDSVNWQPGKNH